MDGCPIKTAYSLGVPSPIQCLKSLLQAPAPLCTQFG